MTAAEARSMLDRLQPPPGWARTCCRWCGAGRHVGVDDRCERCGEHAPSAASTRALITSSVLSPMNLAALTDRRIPLFGGPLGLSVAAFGSPLGLSGAALRWRWP